MAESVLKDSWWTNQEWAVMPSFPENTPRVTVVLMHCHCQIMYVHVAPRKSIHFREIFDWAFTDGVTTFINMWLYSRQALIFGLLIRPDATKVYSAEKKQKFIMLVWVQGSPFHIAAGSHPVQEAWGSQDSLYRGKIQKLLQCCREPYQQIPLVLTIRKKNSLTYLRRTVS